MEWLRKVPDKRESKPLHFRSFYGGRQNKRLGHDVLFKGHGVLLKTWCVLQVMVPSEVGFKSLYQDGGREKSPGSIKSLHPRACGNIPWGSLFHSLVNYKASRLFWDLLYPWGHRAPLRAGFLMKNLARLHSN